MNPPQLSTAVVPPGGFSYSQPLADGSYTLIEGASYDQVLERILKYRLQNGMMLPAGTLCTPEGVSADYNTQVCSKYPWLCTPQRSAPQAIAEVSSGATGWEMLVLRMGRWLDQVRSAPINWVDPKTASERAQICSACPQNVYWESNCGSCNDKITQGSAAIASGARRTAYDQVLRGCRAFGTFQALAVWMREPGGERKYEPPAPCWRL